MLDVFDALDLADRDNGLALIRKDYIEDRIDVYEFERDVEMRLEELQHSDEIHTAEAKRYLQSAMDLDVRETWERKAKEREHPTTIQAADQLLSALYCGPIAERVEEALR